MNRKFNNAGGHTFTEHKHNYNQQNKGYHFLKIDTFKGKTDSVLNLSEGELKHPFLKNLNTKIKIGYIFIEDFSDESINKVNDELKKVYDNFKLLQIEDSDITDINLITNESFLEMTNNKDDLLLKKKYIKNVISSIDWMQKVEIKILLKNVSKNFSKLSDENTSSGDREKVANLFKKINNNLDISNKEKIENLTLILDLIEGYLIKNNIELEDEEIIFDKIDYFYYTLTDEKEDLGELYERIKNNIIEFLDSLLLIFTKNENSSIKDLFKKK